MNELGRTVLIKAGLRGHRQIVGALHDRTTADGECAMGVLHLQMHRTREAALACWDRGTPCVGLMHARFDTSDAESGRIARLNDREGLDFIGIARKMESLEAPTP